ncbi:MAG: GGDEF domain-containing protein [Saccharofermentans sp.]|nr:GGDEF domain-containing protein [Saccharofermentans sp.]
MHRKCTDVARSRMFRKRYLSLKSVSNAMVVISIVIMIFLLLSEYVVLRSFEPLYQATTEYIEMQSAAGSLMSASDYLTEEVQCYTVCGDRKHLDNYFTEAEVTKRRENAIATMEATLPESSALRDLKESMAQSVALMDREYYAMRLVLLAQNDTDIPEILEDIELSDEVLAMSPDELVKLAQDTVFDDAYYEVKAEIRSNIEQCISDIKTTTYDNQREAERKVHTNIVIMIILIVVQSSATVAMLWITLNFETKPIVNAVDNIRKNESIPEEGSKEFRILADAYNGMFDFYNRNVENLNYKASHDELTGLYNRTGYDVIKKSINPMTTAMMVIDADEFKTINDTYGHAIGDLVLKKISKVLTQNFRSNDYICRVGGDEFVVFVVKLTDDPTELITNKVNQINSQLADTSDGIPATSVSVGVAFEKADVDPSVLFRHADIALYHVKMHGRHGCIFYEESLKKPD